MHQKSRDFISGHFAYLARICASLIRPRPRGEEGNCSYLLPLSHRDQTWWKIRQRGRCRCPQNLVGWLNRFMNARLMPWPRYEATPGTPNLLLINKNENTSPTSMTSHSLTHQGRVAHADVRNGIWWIVCPFLRFHNESHYRNQYSL